VKPDSLNRPGVIVYVPIVHVREGHRGCECRYPGCARWSFLDAEGKLILPSGCSHAFGAETFKTGMDYIMFTHEPKQPQT
jgi:hypothetical protein